MKVHNVLYHHPINLPYYINQLTILTFQNNLFHKLIETLNILNSYHMIKIPVILDSHYHFHYYNSALSILLILIYLPYIITQKYLYQLFYNLFFRVSILQILYFHLLMLHILVHQNLHLNLFL